jgi:GSH-dependent disulfide-bond oxidoreductase
MRRLSPAGLAKFSGDWDLRWLRIFRGGPKERLHPGSREMLMARTAEKQKKRRRKVRSAPKSVKTAPPAGSRKPIDLYYWPTPNGWKITVMLEECALPYTMIPVDISKGDQFKPHFLAISPNNRMPAIVDYDGLNGKPISIFESGAILQYLGRKIGKFYPQDERGRVEVDQWLFWQMANLGPKAGEANHFRNYAPEQLPYAIKRFSNEMNRIYGVMNRRLEDREFLAGKYSIADIACIGWASRAERHGYDLSAFANVRRWLETVLARPAVKRGLSVKVEAAFHVDLKDPKVRAVLFNQRAR